jgi:acyl carrier protein
MTIAGGNVLSPEQIDTRAIVAGYLQQRLPSLADRTLDDATPLLAGGVIDSLGILDLTAFLSERLGIEISDEDFEPSNFETFGQLVAFVERKRS